MMKSTTTAYGTVAVTLHWLSAILIIALFASGFRATSTDVSAAKAGILLIHVPIGISILLLTLLRIGWWLFADRKPDHLESDPAWQVFIGKAVHLLLYIVTLGMVAAGIGMLVMSGAGAILFGGSSAPLPNFFDYPPRFAHGAGARLLLVLLALHVVGALYHQYFKKDGTFRRMWYGKS